MIKISINATRAGAFAAGPTSKVTIEAKGNEVAQAVVAARFVLAQLGFGDMPAETDCDDADESTGDTSFETRGK